MSNQINRPSVRNQVRSVTSRLDVLEENFPKLLLAFNQRFQQLEQRLADFEERLDAVIELQGHDDVENYIKDSRAELARQQVEAEKKALAEGIADGYVTAADVIGEKTLVCGHYTDAAGATMAPGWYQLVMPMVTAEYRDQFVGQPAGTSVKMTNGGSFVIEAIYDIDEVKAKAVLDAKTAAAQAAAPAPTTDGQ